MAADCEDAQDVSQRYIVHLALAPTANPVDLEHSLTAPRAIAGVGMAGSGPIILKGDALTGKDSLPVGKKYRQRRIPGGRMCPVTFLAFRSASPFANRYGQDLARHLLSRSGRSG